ncbi:MAG: hypothetical protein KatS3mg131_3321 [Candidatus Tectimicrobiota bacterium]|nr:MAG: hypothetical protein KatS3mg131_3321 [Candidatus Tectomicrobia bacterium]
MAEAQYDFAAVDAIDAEAIGTPGKRTFRVRILRGTQSAALWVEKQQLAALGEAIPRLLEQLTLPDRHAGEPAAPITSFPDEPTVEFKVGRLALGYAAAEDRLVLVAHALEDEEAGVRVPTFSCRFTREQARVLSKACADAVAGGRPLCVLCHRPIDPEGHMCPRANGHQKVSLPRGDA